MTASAGARISAPMSAPAAAPRPSIAWPRTAPPTAPSAAPQIRPVAQPAGAASPASVPGLEATRARSQRARVLASDRRAAARADWPQRPPGTQRAWLEAPTRPRRPPRREPWPRPGAPPRWWSSAPGSQARSRSDAERARAFRLRRGEDTGDGVRRVARGQLDRASERARRRHRDARRPRRRRPRDAQGVQAPARAGAREPRRARRRGLPAREQDLPRRRAQAVGRARRRGARADARRPHRALPRRARRRGLHGPARRAVPQRRRRPAARSPTTATAVDEVEGTLEAARRRVGGWPLPDDGAASPCSSRASSASTAAAGAR